MYADRCASSRPLAGPALCPSWSRRGPALLAVGAVLSLVLVAALITVIRAAPASAHAKLATVTPAADARLTTPPTQVVVTFADPVNASFATVVVTTAAGVSVARGEPTVQAGTITQPLSPNMLSGTYRIAYRVTSEDGHPVTGESRFTLTLNPTASPTTTTAASAPPASATPAEPTQVAPPARIPDVAQSSSPTRLVLPIAASTGLLIFGIGGLMWKRRGH